MFESQQAAFKTILKLARPTMRETMMLAALYAAQAVVCVVLLKLLFNHFHWHAVIWALISAMSASARNESSLGRTCDAAMAMRMGFVRHRFPCAAGLKSARSADGRMTWT